VARFGVAETATVCVGLAIVAVDRAAVAEGAARVPGDPQAASRIRMIPIKGFALIKVTSKS
jgi:hypothetical protein